MITSGSAASMNILLVILIVFSTAKENHGFENRQDRIESSANSRINSTSSLIRTKRYVPHMNSLLRNFNFFSNEGKFKISKKKFFFYLSNRISNNIGESMMLIEISEKS